MQERAAFEAAQSQSDPLERFSAKGIRFAVNNAVQQSKELIP